MAANTINIYSATEDELRTLEGIGERKAERIIKLRDQHATIGVEELVMATDIAAKVWNEWLQQDIISLEKPRLTPLQQFPNVNSVDSLRQVHENQMRDQHFQREIHQMNMQMHDMHESHQQEIRELHARLMREREDETRWMAQQKDNEIRRISQEMQGRWEQERRILIEQQIGQQQQIQKYKEEQDRKAMMMNQTPWAMGVRPPKYENIGFHREMPLQSMMLGSEPSGVSLLCKPKSVKNVQPYSVNGEVRPVTEQDDRSSEIQRILTALPNDGVYRGNLSYRDPPLVTRRVGSHDSMSQGSLRGPVPRNDPQVLHAQQLQQPFSQLTQLLRQQVQRQQAPQHNVGDAVRQAVVSQQNVDRQLSDNRNIQIAGDRSMLSGEHTQGVDRSLPAGQIQNVNRHMVNDQNINIGDRQTQQLFAGNGVELNHMRQQLAEQRHDADRREIEILQQQIAELRHEQQNRVMNTPSTEQSERSSPSRESRGRTRHRENRRRRRSSLSSESESSRSIDSSSDSSDTENSSDEDISRDRGRHERRRNKDKSPPRPKMSSFDGDSKEWESFYFQFKLMAERCNWSKAKKLQRLLECMKGKAAVFVSNRPKRELRKYSTLIKVLKERYHLSKISDASSARKEAHELYQKSSQTLEEFADEVQQQVAIGFKGAGKKTRKSLEVEYFLRGCRDKQAAYVASNQAPKNIREAIKSMRKVTSNEKAIYGHKNKSLSARQVTFEDTVDVRVTDTSSQSPPRFAMTSQSDRKGVQEKTNRSEIERLTALVSTLVKQNDGNQQRYQTGGNSGQRRDYQSSPEAPMQSRYQSPGQSRYQSPGQSRYSSSGQNKYQSSGYNNSRSPGQYRQQYGGYGRQQTPERHDYGSQNGQRSPYRYGQSPGRHNGDRYRSPSRSPFQGHCDRCGKWGHKWRDGICQTPDRSQSPSRSQSPVMSQSGTPGSQHLNW